MKCLRCNYDDQVEKYYHTIRCYMYNIYGHKDKSCSKKVRQPKRIVSYVTDKKVWREKERCPLQSQRLVFHIK